MMMFAWYALIVCFLYGWNPHQVCPAGSVYLVPLGFVPVLVCSTMPNRTCVEQKTGVPVGYVTEL
jgi:hypothetical protein